LSKTSFCNISKATNMLFHWEESNVLRYYLNCMQCDNNNNLSVFEKLTGITEYVRISSDGHDV